MYIVDGQSWNELPACTLPYTFYNHDYAFKRGLTYFRNTDNDIYTLPDISQDGLMERFATGGRLSDGKTWNPYDFGDLRGFMVQELVDAWLLLDGISNDDWIKKPLPAPNNWNQKYHMGQYTYDQKTYDSNSWDTQKNIKMVF